MTSAKQVRELLNEEIDKLRSKETSSDSLRAIANAVGKMISSAKCQVEYNKLTGYKKRNIAFFSE